MGFLNNFFGYRSWLKEPKYCEHCDDTGEIEVIVMGTDDTNYVECTVCKNRPSRVRTKRNRTLTKILDT